MVSPAKAVCRLQGTASAPLSTAPSVSCQMDRCRPPDRPATLSHPRPNGNRNAPAVLHAAGPRPAMLARRASRRRLSGCGASATGGADKRLAGGACAGPTRLALRRRASYHADARNVALRTVFRGATTPREKNGTSHAQTVGEGAADLWRTGCASPC